jgi:hypothetical protein
MASARGAVAAAVLATVAVASFAAATPAEESDVVMTTAGELRGTVRHLTSKGLVIRTADGPAAFVSEDELLDFSWAGNADYTAGLAAFGARDWERAAASLARAGEGVGAQPWFSARMQERIRYALQRQGKHGQAADVLRGLVNGHPREFLRGHVCLPAWAPDPETDLQALADDPIGPHALFVSRAVRATLLARSGELGRAARLLRGLDVSMGTEHAALAQVAAEQVAFYQAAAPPEAVGLAAAELPPGLTAQLHFWDGRGHEGAGRKADARYAYLKTALLYPGVWPVAPPALARALDLMGEAGLNEDAKALEQELHERYAFFEGQGDADQ